MGPTTVPSVSPATATTAQTEAGSAPATARELALGPARRLLGAVTPHRLAWASVVAAVVPIVVATVRAVLDDWVAIGDNAYFVVRSRDVLTEHHPLLGTWTSASLTVGVDMNNPGPVYFDLFALPAKIGGDAGLAVGVALMNIAAVVGMALVARRVAGPRAVVPAMLAAAGLSWSMGSEMLFDPWQPHGLMLPFLCFLFLVWGLAAGDLVLLPWLVGVASLIVQTHVGYALLVPALIGWAVGAAGVGLWQARRTATRATSAPKPDVTPEADAGSRSEPEADPRPGADPEVTAQDWPQRRRRALRYSGVALVVALVGWSQPLYEQRFGRGDGNFTRLWQGAGADQPRVGMRFGMRLVAQILAVPPFWGRPSMRDAFGTIVERSSMPSGLVSTVALLGVAVLVATALARARRRGDAPAAAAATTGLAIMVVSLLAATTMPVANYGVAAHHLRWLWPVALFLTFVVALGLLTSSSRSPSSSAPLARLGLAGLALAVAVLGVVNLPYTNAGVGPSYATDSMPTLRSLLPQLSLLRDERGVLFEVEGLRFAEPYSGPILSELQRLGVPWYVDDSAFVRQFGEKRAWTGDASVRIFILEGHEAFETPARSRRIALADGLSDAERRELTDLQDELTTFIADGGLVVRAGLSAEAGPMTDTQLRDADYLFASGDGSTRFARRLVYLVEDDLLAVPERWAPVLERYAELQQQADALTVAVFAEPLGDD